MPIARKCTARSPAWTGNCGNVLSGFWLYSIPLASLPWGDLFASIKKSALLLPVPAARADFDSYDLDLPLEVDDEYWETNTSTEVFKQPRDVPSMASAFNYMVKWSWILGFIYRTLVSIGFKPNVLALTFPSMLLTNRRLSFQRRAAERNRY